MTVTTNFAVIHRTAAWVDFNLNGVFDGSELVLNNLSVNGPSVGTYTGTFTIPANITTNNFRMRVLVQANANTGTPSPCGVNIVNAEVEDYILRVQPLATRNAQALPSLSLYPTPTPDGHLYLALADASAAGLYTTEVQSLLGATVLRTALRLGPTATAELDLSALPAGVYLLHLRDAHGQTAVRRVVRE
ncbi:MAG: T9SS type A sorting domain-containing protein [Bacteroidota bacterium]|nr:T9SS type A sorting domain-containing protein [Bacteroidota bacterium]